MKTWGNLRPRPLFRTKKLTQRSPHNTFTNDSIELENKKFLANIEHWDALGLDDHYLCFTGATRHKSTIFNQGNPADTYSSTQDDMRTI